jgi:hypothetical protein
MRIPRAPLVFAAVLVLAAASGLACSSMAPPSVAPQDPQTSATYQQRAGYSQQYPQQPRAYPSTLPQYGSPSYAQPPASSVPEAIAQLDQAEQALAFLFAAQPGSDLMSGQPGQPAPSPSVTAGAPGVPLDQGAVCSIACAALASMKRSVDHLCGMAGESDAACGGARARVQRAEQRVTAACPSCAAN